MADINDRLERLSRRDELARRVRQRAMPASISGVGEDFLEVVEAVAQVVRRHPGMSVMLAPGDGRRGSTVIRVTERHGEAEVAPVTVTGDADDAGLGADPAIAPMTGMAGLPPPPPAATGVLGGPLGPPGFAAGPTGPGFGAPAPGGSWRPPAMDTPTVPRAVPETVPFEEAPTEVWRWER
jgi:hypothetical protein